MLYSKLNSSDPYYVLHKIPQVVVHAIVGIQDVWVGIRLVLDHLLTE
jgi:hypothetical protein